VREREKEQLRKKEQELKALVPEVLCKECNIKPTFAKRHWVVWFVCEGCRKKTFNYVRVSDASREWNKLNE